MCLFYNRAQERTSKEEYEDKKKILIFFLLTHEIDSHFALGFCKDDVGCSRFNLIPKKNK